jgi:acyl carrier protein
VNREAAWAALTAAVARVLELDPGSLTERTRFVDDLKADSLAIVEIVEIVEETLPGARFDDEALFGLHTLGDAVTLLVEA